MLKVCDLIRLCGVNLGQFKIHLAKHLTDSPLDAFFEGRFKAWQENQSQKNFQCEHIVSLISLGYDRWLFAGVWKVDGVRPDGDRFRYETTEVPGLEALTGRLVVQFKRDFRASYLLGTKYSDDLLVAEIRPERLSIQDFPGFAKVRIEFEQLKYVISRGITSWKSALGSVAGVYLIADKQSGKLYVGSAYGAEGIWGRWQLYAEQPHGQNKELKLLLAEKGEAYALNFRFSVLEVCDLLTSRDDVIRRETHWKEALLSRSFGYNSN